jgi:hypothetical protein
MWLANAAELGAKTRRRGLGGTHVACVYLLIAARSRAVTARIRAALPRTFVRPYHKNDEAPACMRCRGLARPVSDTRRLPQRAGPPGQSAIRTLSVLPPVQDTWPEFRLPGPRAPTRHYSLIFGVAPKSLRASC